MTSKGSPSSTGRSLRDFAEESKKPKCGCSIKTKLPPEVLEELERGWKEDGIRATVIMRWLESEGYNVSSGSLQNHFNRGHHMHE